MYIKTGKKRIDIGFIKNKLQKTDQVFFKEWLLEKIEEIEKGVIHIV